MLQAALERRGLRVAAVVGPLETVAVAGARPPYSQPAALSKVWKSGRGSCG